MGKHNFSCTDCHQSNKHQIKGRSISVSHNDQNQIYCTDCHDAQLHSDQRLNRHTARIACQTCHIPAVALKQSTKVHWDWSQAGHDFPEDEHEYLKIKGRFVYKRNLSPDYFWFNGLADNYIIGDKIRENGITLINEPMGDRNDANARIWPFKVHTAKQPYDRQYRYLLQPKTYGEGGFWTEFDWDKSLRLGSLASGLPYSGEYGFIDTAMFWPLTHMVSPKSEALQCVDCHSKGGRVRIQWEALGYDGDPMLRGTGKTRKI